MKRCMGCMELYTDAVDMCPYCGYVENTKPEEAFHLVPGTKIGNRFILGKVLGFGGFGITYIGFDELTEKKVAVKEYLPSEFATRALTQTKVTIYSGEKTEQFGHGLNRFVEEARQLAKFNETEGVINIYDCIMENDTAYIIMELLEGESLKKYLIRNKKLSLEEIQKIMLPIFYSLEAIHAVGLIHRDIAPDNIFLTTDGRVKLLDFGAARYASATHSRSLSVIYKPGYAPEEQYQSRGNQGPWTDVYALAATMYKMLTGVTPDTSLERRANETLKAPSKLGVNIPRNKETALLNALNVQVENRTQSVRQFLDEWESLGDVARIIDKVKKFDVGALSKKTKMAIIGTIAALAVAIVLVVSTGELAKISDAISVQSGKARVPSVVNETIEAAQVRVEEAGLQMEIIGREYSSEIKKDMILSQNYKSGALISIAEKLSVTVSGGIRQIYVTEVSGKSVAVAKEELVDGGFTVVTEEVYSAVPEGCVVNTNMEVGTACDEGSTIIIYVSKGIDPSTIVEEKKYVVEDFTGKNLEAVQKLLEEEGIYLDSSERIYDDVIAAGHILSQNVDVGEELKAGSTISVVVSLGKEMVRIPELTYKEKKEAEAALAGLALNVEWREEYSSVVKEGLVVSQSLSAGDEVDKGSALVLIVSKGPEPQDIPASTTPPEETDTSTSVEVQGENTDIFVWETYKTKFDEGVIITEIVGIENITKLVIPEKIDGKEVMALERTIYLLKSNMLQEIWLPSGLTHVYGSIFLSCSSLENIYVAEGNEYYTSIDGILYEKVRTTYGSTSYELELVAIPNKKIDKIVGNCLEIPKEATYMGSDVSGHRRIETIYIHKGVKMRGGKFTYDDGTEYPFEYNNAFFDRLENLKEIVVDEENNSLVAIDGILYSKDMKTLVSCPRNWQKTELIIPEGVEKIGMCAFSNCKYLTSIVMPTTLQEIGYLAFKDCVGLKEISLGINVSQIAPIAFLNCKNFVITNEENFSETLIQAIRDGSRWNK